ncbi:AlgP family protein, partial [Stutzerimonas stutzeri]
MPAKKKSVTTPLHLLQQLSHSLIEHLDKACSQAIKDAEGALAKLQKQRGKAQDKLTKARAKLDEAGSTGKPKAQTKARARLGELEESLTLLQTRQSETLNYLAELKRDAEHSLKLAQGIRQVADAADQALQGRQQPTKPAAARPAAGKSAPVAAKPRASTTRAPAAKADSAPAKAGTTTTASKPAAKPAAKSPA